MNALSSYFARSDDSPSSLARRLGRAPSTITRLMKDGPEGRRASIALAKEIETATGGQVRALDLLGLCAAPELERAS